MTSQSRYRASAPASELCYADFSSLSQWFLISDIQFNDLKASWDLYRYSVLQAIDRVGESGWLILGSEVREFENALAEDWRLDHCIGCASGLDALELALRASGLEAGQKVLTTPLSAFATSLAII